MILSEKIADATTGKKETTLGKTTGAPQEVTLIPTTKDLVEVKSTASPPFAITDEIDLMTLATGIIMSTSSPTTSAPTTRLPTTMSPTMRAETTDSPITTLPIVTQAGVDEIKVSTIPQTFEPELETTQRPTSKRVIVESTESTTEIPTEPPTTATVVTGKTSSKSFVGKGLEYVVY